MGWTQKDDVVQACKNVNDITFCFVRQNQTDDVNLLCQNISSLFYISFWKSKLIDCEF